MIRAFRKLKSKQPDINQVQENVEQTLKAILQVPIINGVLLTDISLLSASINRVEHKLGRDLRGYMIVRKDAPATIYDTKSNSVVDRNFLLLSTSQDTVVSVWVF